MGAYMSQEDNKTKYNHLIGRIIISDEEKVSSPNDCIEISKIPIRQFQVQSYAQCHYLMKRHPPMITLILDRKNKIIDIIWSDGYYKEYKNEVGFLLY